MSPDEAAPILADFAGKLNMEMSGKFWAPSTYRFSLLISSTPLDATPHSLFCPVTRCVG